MVKDDASYQAHNQEYVVQTVETASRLHENNTRNRVQYIPEDPLGEMLDVHGTSLEVAVDIGSGIGWASSLMSSYFKTVYSMEPSVAAQDLAKAVCKDKENIVWINGFAEEALSQMTLEKPAFFYTACVLSHLEDSTVKSICQQIDALAKPGSVIAFSENWGMFLHTPLWHSRSQAWWQERFPSWKLSFRTTPGSPLGVFKAFHGVKP